MGLKFLFAKNLKPTRDNSPAMPGWRSKGDRRRATRPQGEALEILGHAIEYLIDSRPFLPAEMGGKNHMEALDLLKCRSWEVFAECAEVVSPIERFKYWLGGILNY